MTNQTATSVTTTTADVPKRGAADPGEGEPATKRQDPAVKVCILDQLFVDGVVRPNIDESVFGGKWCTEGPVDWREWRVAYHETCARWWIAGRASPHTDRERGLALLETFICNLSRGNCTGSVEVQLFVHSVILADIQSRSSGIISAWFDLIAESDTNGPRRHGIVDGMRAERYRRICYRIVKDLDERRTPVVGTHLLWTSGRVYGIDELVW